MRVCKKCKCKIASKVVDIPHHRAKAYFCPVCNEEVHSQPIVLLISRIFAFVVISFFIYSVITDISF